MASKKLVQSVFRCASGPQAMLAVAAPRISLNQARIQLHSSPQTYRYLHTNPTLLAVQSSTSATAEAVTTPKAEPLPAEETDPAKHAAFLGEADSNDGFEAFKDAHGDPPPALDPTNSAFLGEADSDDGFESRKEIDGVKLEAVDATNSAYLGEADGDDGFEAHREAHPDEGDHKIEDPVESGLHGQTGEQDR